MTAHPTDFYIAHRLFRFFRTRLDVEQWGSLTDGPADKAELMEALREDRSRDQLSMQNLRVWHFQADVPPRDVTEDVLAEFFAQEVDA